MDSSRKRKAAANATPSTSDGSATKKIKLLNSKPAPAGSTENSVQRIGQKLITQLNNATDKTGRSIIDAFIELPPRDELPDYYRVIQLPIAISTIEEKLRNNAYPTVSAVESDFKRMINNAKQYNESKSEIYEDAERIRKLIYNFMKINNPAYETDPNYQAQATPIPTSTKITLTNGSRPAEQPKQASPPATKNDQVKDEPRSRAGSAKPRLSLGPKASEAPSERASDRKSSMAPSAADGGESEDMDFTGKSFQEAQQMIIAEAIRYTDEEGLEIFTPFINLPSRKLENYYKFIKTPMSLKGVQKKTRGQHGRDPPTGVSDFKTWDSFEQCVSLIWKNARSYNEDGSEMFQLANDFEEYFKSRLAEAKEKVKEPTSTRIKLGGPAPPPTTAPKSGITINLSQTRQSPTPGMSVDNDALARQRRLVNAGVNGHQHTPTPAQTTAQPPSQSASGVAVRPPSIPPSATHALPVQSEKATTASPGATAAPSTQPTTNGMMPPPLTRGPSGSPYMAPNGIANGYHYTAPALLPPTAVRSYSTSQALLPLVTIATHPQLRSIPKPYSMTVTPHPILAHQSTTITLPSTHYYLQISPTISRELSMGRAYKMFVTVNGTRLTQRDTQFHADTGKRTHVYEGSLATGVNRIEVEVAAAKTGSAGGEEKEKEKGPGLDVEKVTVFANLLRAS